MEMKFHQKFYSAIALGLKEITIRIDPENKWQVGQSLECVFVDDTGNEVQLTCKLSVRINKIEKIEVRFYDFDLSHVYNDYYIPVPEAKKSIKLFVNDVKLSHFQAHLLFNKERFNSTKDFYDFFKGQSFVGKLIHLSIIDKTYINT